MKKMDFEELLDASVHVNALLGAIERNEEHLPKHSDDVFKGYVVINSGILRAQLELLDRRVRCLLWLVGALLFNQLMEILPHLLAN